MVYWAGASGKVNPAANLLQSNKVHINALIFKVPYKRFLKKFRCQDVGGQVISLKDRK